MRSYLHAAVVAAAIRSTCSLPLSGSGATPVNIVQCPGGQDCLVPDLVVDNQSGAWHLVYGTTDKQAYYQQSIDNGNSWTRRVKLNAAGLNVTTTMGERGPKLSQAPDGTLHVAWLDFWFPGAQTRARYLHSLDRGTTWSVPVAASNDTGIDGVTVVADSKAVTVLYHTTDGTPVPNSTSSTWLFQVVSTDGGQTFGAPALVSIDGGSQPAVACSMCMVRARADGNGNTLIAFRSAINNIRDFYVLNGSAVANAYTSLRVPANPPWYVTSCPMNGPEMSLDPQGRAVVAYMTSDANNVFWTVHDPAAPSVPFSGPNGTPTTESNQRYPTAVSTGTVGGNGDVLMVWQVGPMAVSGTAVVKYAVYGLDGRYSGVGGTVGTSFAGTKATAFVGSNGHFYIVTTAS